MRDSETESTIDPIDSQVHFQASYLQSKPRLILNETIQYIAGGGLIRGA